MGIVRPRTLGSYQLVSELGEGGSGVVWLAKDGDGREVALKVLHDHPVEGEDMIGRFKREARISIELDHPHIVRTLDVGMANGVVFIASEYLPGGNLGERLKERNALGELEALQVIRGVCSALAALETHGFVHRDVKPDNVLFDAQGRAKLADLGLARSIEGHSERFTRPGQILGTPSYMSPEQAEGKTDLDIRTDLYSLGAVLYHCLAGQPPYVGKSNYAILKQHLAGVIPEIRTAAPHVGEDVSAIIRSLLQRRPEDRPSSAAGALAAFDALIAARTPRSLPTQKFRASDTVEVDMAKYATLVDDSTPRAGETIRNPLIEGAERALAAAALHFEGPKGARTFYVYVGTRLLFGRDADPQSPSVCLRVRPSVSNDKANQRISRRHFEVVYSGQGPTIVDLGSRGGTGLDGAVLEANAPRPLPPRAIVTVAQTLILIARILPQPPSTLDMDGRGCDSDGPSVLLERPLNGPEYAYLLVPGRVALSSPAQVGIMAGLNGDTELCALGGKLWVRSGGFGGNLWAPLTDGLRFLVERTEVIARSIHPAEQG